MKAAKDFVQNVEDMKLHDCAKMNSNCLCRALYCLPYPIVDGPIVWMAVIFSYDSGTGKCMFQSQATQHSYSNIICIEQKCYNTSVQI